MMDEGENSDLIISRGPDGSAPLSRSIVVPGSVENTAFENRLSLRSYLAKNPYIISLST